MDSTDANSVEPDAGEAGSGAPPEVTEQNHAPDITKEYRNGDLSVLWYAQRCIHSAACVRANPRVFNPQRRPWIDLHADDESSVIAAVEACPTGALEYVRHNGPPEPTPELTTLRAIQNGPMFVRGNLEIRDSSGAIIRRATRAAFCRCGKSTHMPFCDNSHRAKP